MKLLLLHEDSSDLPKKTTKPEGTKSKKSFKGAHGGGNEYHQMDADNEFEVHKPLDGHKQEGNVETEGWFK